MFKVFLFYAYNSVDGFPLFDSPEGIAWHDGILYVSDTGAHIIRKVDLATMQVSLVAGDIQCVEETEGENDVVNVKKTCTGQPAGTSSFGDATDGTGRA